ncbi:MAG: hypothetical protein F4142_08585 [Nitrospira sp. SB0675_bin_23]|nr:hypothetical protein [Nitrospira sp. SB0661_bin_20]MYH02613.1 hypothetical protein [Nitrospira sp. SB0675_bin_23]
MNSEDHPFFTRESFAAYYKTIIKTTEFLSNGVHDGKFIEKDPFREEVFDRICSGLLASPDALPKHIAFYLNAQQ